MSDSWYKRNERTIKWSTMLGSWIAGAALIACGISAPAGIAIILAGSSYAGARPVFNGIKAMAKRMRERNNK